MPNAKKKKEMVPKETKSRCINITLKSIRNPKFNITLEDVQASDNILMIKERLLGDPDGPLADMNYGVSNIKFLISGKVINDMRSLEDVAGDKSLVSFTVLLTQPTEEPELQEAMEEVEINDSLWAEIRGVIVKRLGDSRGDKVFTRLKNSW